MSINRVNISGNLGKDPEIRSTSNGTAILEFTVAVNDRHKNQSTGEWEDYPNWVSCTMFGTRAEAVSRYLSKGCKVAIEGKLRYSSWEKDGQKRSKLEVVVDEIEFMSRDEQRTEPNYGPPPAQRQPQQQSMGGDFDRPHLGVVTPPPPRQQPAADFYDEDIAF